MKECVGCHGITVVDCHEFVVAGAGAGAAPPPAPAALPATILEATQAASTESSSGLTPLQIVLIGLGGTTLVVGGVVYTKWDDIKERVPGLVPGIAFGIETDNTAQINLL